jgi:hypothetical protein
MTQRASSGDRRPPSEPLWVGLQPWGELLPNMLWCSGSYLIPFQTLAVFCPPVPLLLSTISRLTSQMFSLPAWTAGLLTSVRPPWVRRADGRPLDPEVGDLQGRESNLSHGLT